MKIIPHNRPTLDDREIAAVAKVLKSNWLIGGTEVAKLEQYFIHNLGRQYAIATNSGHAALHMGLLALGVGAGDEVILPAFTVTDIVNAIYYVGAKPVLVDSEPTSVSIDPMAVEGKISKKTKAIIIPHMFGIPAKVDEILSYNIPVIEDCAQALGSRYKGAHVGSLSTISIFSFFVGKMITSGGQGGMLVTDNPTYAGIVRAKLDYNAPTAAYQVHYNYPMTDVSASIGNVQLDKLQAFIKRREQIAKEYQKVLIRKHITFFPTPSQTDINYFRFIIACANEQERQKLQKQLTGKRIMTKPPLLYEELPHVVLGIPGDAFPYTITLSKTLLSIPLYPTLTDTEVDYIATTLDHLL